MHRVCYEWPAAHILRRCIAFWISKMLSCAPLCAFGVLVQHLSFFQKQFLQGLLLRRGFAAARSVLLGKLYGRVKNSFQTSPSTHTATFCTKQHCMLRTQNVVSAPFWNVWFPGCAIFHHQKCTLNNKEHTAINLLQLALHGQI